MTFVAWPILPEKKLKEVQIICIIIVTFKALEEKKNLKFPIHSTKLEKLFKNYNQKQNYRSAFPKLIHKSLFLIHINEWCTHKRDFVIKQLRKVLHKFWEIQPKIHFKGTLISVLKSHNFVS